MRKYCPLIATFLLLLLSIGSGSASEQLRQLPPADLDYLKSAKSITVYGIVPNEKGDEPKVLGTYPIVSSAVISTPAVRDIVIEGLRQSIEFGVSSALCFIPHHAITVTGNDATQRTYVMCFACCETRQFRGSDITNDYTSFVIAPHFQSLFDSILAANDSSYLEKTRRKGIAPFTVIKIGEEITPFNSQQSTQWKDEISGDEISSIDYARHPKAKKFLTGSNLIRPSDFVYTDKEKSTK